MIISSCKKKFIVNIPYKMFLTIQLMHLTCRKDRIQSPTRKEGQDLFWRTSDDSSRNNPRMKNNMMNVVMWHYYVTLLIKNLPTMKKRQRRKNGRMLWSRSTSRSWRMMSGMLSQDQRGSMLWLPNGSTRSGMM